MDRLACVDLPSLPLQLLFGRKPEWARWPAAVVDRDHPQGVIEWVNERARARGVLPGQRYGAALALAGELRAGEVPPVEREACVKKLVEELRRFTPGVEPSSDQPGVFWLDAGGLGLLYPSLAHWARVVRGNLLAAGLHASVVVGFTRFGGYAVARGLVKSGVVVFETADDEARAMKRVPLARVGLQPEVYIAMQQLAIRTVGDFLALPPGGLRRRFGVEAHALHQLATGARAAPLQPRPVEEKLERRLELDSPERSRESLLFWIKGEMEPLFPRLAARGEALAELAFTLTVEKHGEVTERVRPAEPTLDGKQLAELVRLRLESTTLPAGVTRVVVAALGAPATAEQLRLFAERPRRDPRAAARAIARLRAALGDARVVRARLLPGHLPEARFGWEPTSALEPAKPRAVSSRPLIRRLRDRPSPLPPRPAREPDGWLLDGVQQVARLDGPYLLSGGWWHQEIAREYYFAELRSGALHWIYYDKRRRVWFAQGRVA